MLRIAATTIGLAWLALIGAYVFAGATAGFTAGAGVAALAALAIAASGFLYAWREPAALER